jgi:ABC-type multidrug transport system fused ATPase/permease subunit
MLEEFQTLDLFPISVYTVLTNLAVSLACGIVIALVYRYIYKGPSYMATYVNSLVLLSLITTLVIMIIGNNLARAFGLVGAMSIIRFRTAVRDVQDIVYIFFALTVGMASGVGLYALAIAGTLVICLVSVVLVTFNFGAPGKAEYVLQLIYLPNKSTESQISQILGKYCRGVRLSNLKSQGEGQDVEAFYLFSLRRKYKSTELVEEFTSLSEKVRFNLYFDQDEANMAF